MDAFENAPRRARELLGVAGALAGAALAATAAVLLVARVRGQPVAAPAVATSTTTSAAAPAKLAVLEPTPEPVAHPQDRPVPLEVLRTSSVVASPRAPGLRLVRVETTPRSDSGWEEARALIRDETTGDARSYAIGDLLPHGSLLVGIGTESVEALVGDAHLVRLHDDGRVEELEDLAAASEPAALPLAKNAEPVDVDELRLAILDLKSDDPTEVQAAIDRLIAGGDPALDLLAAQVDSEAAVRSAEYAFPSGSQIEMRPKVVGDVVMFILERITGQTFGDVTREDLSEAQRREIARAWRRWLE